MVVKKIDVAFQMLATQQEALLIQCFALSLSLAVKDLISHYKILGNVMGTVGEITVLAEFSPKRVQNLSKILRR